MAVTANKITKPTLIKVEAVLASLESGVPISKACEAAGLNRTTFYVWKRSSKENEQRYYDVIDSRTLIVEDSLFKSAKGGNVAAQIFWLKNRARDRWKDRFDNEVATRDYTSIDEIREEIGLLLESRTSPVKN